jgi:hypothetical protein
MVHRESQMVWDSTLKSSNQSYSTRVTLTAVVEEKGKIVISTQLGSGAPGLT